MIKLIAIIAFSIFTVFCDAHGALVKPLPRTPLGFGTFNDPIGASRSLVFEFPDQLGEEFVCRRTSPNPNVGALSWTAGKNVEIEANFAVPHPGSCEFFLSYDFNKPRNQMRWFKIGNWQDCGINSETKYPNAFPEDVRKKFSLFLPTWLPKGKAVFRFMWSAQHNVYAEYYVDCVDVIMQSPANKLPNDVKVYPLIGKSLWREGIAMWVGDEDEQGRQWGNAQVKSDYVTGPPCAESTASYNQCSKTAPNTSGYISIDEFASDDNSFSGNDDSNNGFTSTTQSSTEDNSGNGFTSTSESTNPDISTSVEPITPVTGGRNNDKIRPQDPNNSCSLGVFVSLLVVMFSW